jgi:hypothetical protein
MRESTLLRGETAAFHSVTLIDMDRVHELRPMLTNLEDDVRYLLCAYPEDGICTLHVNVSARDLVRWVFPTTEGNR